MNKSIYIIILFYFVPFLVKGYSLPPLKNYGTCKDVYNDSITNEYTIISKKDASVVWYRAVNASDTIVVLSLKSKPQLEVGEQYRLTLGKISRLKILKGRYSALIFDKDTVFLGITFSREDCELQIKTYHLLLDVESIKVLNQEDVSSPKGSIWPPPPYFHYRGDSASYQLSLQRILFLADNRYLKDKYVFDDGIRQIILSFVNDKVMKVEITDWRSLRHTCFGSSCLSFVETYAYHHLKDMRTI